MPAAHAHASPARPRSGGPPPARRPSALAAATARSGAPPSRASAPSSPAPRGTAGTWTGSLSRRGSPSAPARPEWTGAGSRVVRCAAADGGWRLEIESSSGREVLKADFVADATGRPAHLARRLGARRLRYDRLVGAASLLRSPAPSTDTYTLVEAVPAGWWYSALLADGRLAVGLDDRRRPPGPRCRLLVERPGGDRRNPAPASSAMAMGWRGPRGSSPPRPPVWTRSREKAGWLSEMPRRPTIPSPRTVSDRPWAPASTPPRRSRRPSPAMRRPVSPISICMQRAYGACLDLQRSSLRPGEALARSRLLAAAAAGRVLH